MSKFFTVRKICTMALLIALEVVFARFLSIENGAFKISFGFLPIAIAGMTLGPVGGGLVGVIADILGMIIFSKGNVYFFPYTISQFLYGFGFGLMLYKKQLSVLKLSIFVAIQYIVINVFLGSLWTYLYYIFIVGKTKAFTLFLVSRLSASAINFPAQIILVNLISKHLYKPLKKFYE